MRRARAGDHWRRIASVSPPFRITSIGLTGIRGLGEPSTEVESGSFLAVCGHNGSGKTTLLRCIENCLLDRDPHSIHAREMPTSGTVTIEVVKRGAEQEVTLDLGTRSKSGPGYPNVFYLEPSADAPDLMRRLRGMNDLHEILETVDKRIHDTEIFSYAVGKHYSEVESYEIELGDDEVIPYFIVESHGSSYGSESMGLGEFSMFYLIWRLDNVPEESIVLIEEPEAFVSPRSQGAAANILAKFTDEKKLFTIASTHSPWLLGSTPQSCLRVLVRTGATCCLMPATEQDEHLAVLGIDPPLLGIIFVEDIAAEYALKSVLREFAPGLLSSVAIVRRGSWNQVVESLNGIPEDGHPMAFFGILDGDCRNHAINSHWPVFFLPGTQPPDVQLLSASEGNIELLAERLGLEVRALRLHCANLEGTCPHDWASELARALSIELCTALGAMASCWISDRRWFDDSRALAQQIAGCLNTA